ncbi:MAG: helix-turn-helix transcriptional regulator [Akkermansiaceae bacterium]|nr:helix-turn-helix transcriptional regulator [Verrucomicrobiales bacterium]
MDSCVSIPSNARDTVVAYNLATALSVGTAGVDPLGRAQARSDQGSLLDNRAKKEAEPASFHEPHLTANQFTIAAGASWQAVAGRWSLVRLASGLGYWHGADLGYQEFFVGDALLISPSTNCSILASRISEIKLHVVGMDLTSLWALFTIQESRAVSAFERSNQQRIIHLPHQHPVSRRFTTVAEIDSPNPVVRRLQLLELFAELLGEALQAKTPSELAASSSPNVSTPLRKLVRETPENELIRSSVKDLAQRLACSERHFSRLFHQERGASIRDTQQRLRLEKARRLLEESNEKVGTIATQSGFRSQSLLNVLFKRRYQMSPLKWRAQAQRNLTASEKSTPAPVPSPAPGVS